MKAVFASSVRAGDESRAVTPLELFFDLVFVFAITQVSHFLLEHLTQRQREPAAGAWRIELHLGVVVRFGALDAASFAGLSDAAAALDP